MKEKKVEYQEDEGFYVAGVRFHDIDRCNNLKVGDTLQLVADPFNEYDPKAIKVECDGAMLGFIPAKLTRYIHPIIRTGSYDCRVIEVNSPKQPWTMLKICVKGVDNEVLS